MSIRNRIRGVAMLVRIVSGSLSLALFVVALHAPAQSLDGPPAPDSQTPILRLSTRVVLTDVTVTDAKGTPVRGLTQSDFRILDDDHPQTITAFVEHIPGAGAAPVASPANSSVVSNEFLLHPPDPVNVVLIDTTNLGIVDQMILYQQLTRFVSGLPVGDPVAIYFRSGEATLLLQNFTSDRGLLLAAVRRAIPHFQSPDAFYASDLDTLQQMANYLRQVPGRKNLLWFSGGSLLFLSPDPADYADEPDRRPLYDLLESERIAIYPIDARGLMTGILLGMTMQQMQIDQDAQATGGQAYYNNNGLSKIAQHILSTDGSYYTLTYSPDDLHRDGRWHKVRVEVDHLHYHLSYRQGYYDDGQNNQPAPGKTRTMLRADGSSTKVPRDPGEPLIFQARVLPASLAPAPATPTSGVEQMPLKHGQTPYIVHYSLAAGAIAPASISGNIGTDQLRSAIIAFDHNGNALSRVLEAVTFKLREDMLRNQPDASLTFDQTINLPKGEINLLIVIWDANSGRFGTVSVPLNVKKASN